MKHVLVPLLTQEDVAALPKVVAQLKAAKPESIVILNNPSLGVSPDGATAKIDKDIADLEKAKSEAVSREDFEGAKNLKSQIEEKKTERQDVLRDGWKSVPLEERYKAYDKLVDPFAFAFQNTGTYVENLPLIEDSSHETILVSLANLKPWPKCLPEGQWAMLLPRDASVPDGPLPLKTTYQSDNVVLATDTTSTASPRPVQAVSSSPRVEAAPKPKKAQKTPPSDPREARSQELGRYMKLKQVAKQHGISMDNRPWQQVREEVLAIEFPAVAAA